ncbi:MULTISPECIES: hypothetical protein [Enterobacterales]|uniref:hypothetical protein n=1 Tax=Enterobacterales TaxID=91347 RepID=UPI002ED90DB3
MILQRPGLIAGAFSVLTKKEKAWFFLLCGEQPKINELIFLIVCFATHDKTVFVRGLSSVSTPRQSLGVLFSPSPEIGYYPPPLFCRAA